MALEMEAKVATQTAGWIRIYFLDPARGLGKTEGLPSRFTGSDIQGPATLRGSTKHPHTGSAYTQRVQVPNIWCSVDQPPPPPPNG